MDARRLVAQSIAFACAEGPLPHREEDPLDPAQTGVITLESQVLAAPLDSAVQRYGRLYGPGTWFESPTGAAPLSIDAAALACALAVKSGAPGIYNFAEDDGAVSSDKAKRVFPEWSANWREGGAG